MEKENFAGIRCALQWIDLVMPKKLIRCSSKVVAVATETSSPPKRNADKCRRKIQKKKLKKNK